MDTFTFDNIVKAINGTPLKGKGRDSYPSISIDSRTITRGELFIAIKGKNFDGHDFVIQALKKGAGGAIISDKSLIENEFFQQRRGRSNSAIIAVQDTLTALHDIARDHRKRFDIHVVGITGSNGKSTSKEMSASVAGMKFNVLKNEGNLNNQIGLPLTILKMNENHTIAILEMGMSKQYEIKKLCEISEPDIGLITNIGKAHLEQLGSIENIRDAKGELVKAIGEGGTVILNSDDSLVMGLKDSFHGRVITFGINAPSDVTASDIRNRNLGYQFVLTMGGAETMVVLLYPGYHNIYNVLSAAAVGMSLGMDIEDIRRGIESFKPLPMRMEKYMIHGEITILNDAYNANPSSTEAAIKTLSIASFPGKKFLVAGDMLELGEASEDAHRYIGRLAASASIDYLITVGNESKYVFYEAIRSGMPRDKVYACDNFDEVVFILDDELEPGDCVMIKGSRGMKMEDLVERIIKLRSQGKEYNEQGVEGQESEEKPLFHSLS